MKSLRFFSKQRQIQALTKSLFDERALILKKGLVPKHTLSLIQGDHNLKDSVKEYQMDKLKEHVCPICGIRLRVRHWMRQHIKTHYEKAQYQEKIREHDQYELNSKVYFE